MRNSHGWRISVLVPLLAVLVLGLHGAAWGQKTSPEEFQFLGVKVSPWVGEYLVLKDANVRARPATRGKKVGRAPAGDRVYAVGRVKGPWLAVRVDGKDFGFIYEPILLPVIEGRLSEPVTGELPAAGVGEARHQCTFSIAFEDKSPAQGQSFEFADYDVTWTCVFGAEKKYFRTPMFLTEGPHVGRKPVHQVTVDILDIDGGLEEIFSTHMLWDRPKAVLKFDSVSIKRFGTKPRQATAKAEDVRAALAAAAAMAYRTWNASTWKALQARARKTAN